MRLQADNDEKERQITFMKIDLFENQTPNGQLKLDNEAKSK